MNQNGGRDRRETVTEAWQRLGLLKADETFNRARYLECVEVAGSELRKEGFITEEIVHLYRREAAEREVLPAR